MRKSIAVILFAGAVVFGGFNQAHAEDPCVSANVVATDFIVNDAIDFAAYFAAVEAANALCAPIPATGSDSSVMLQLGVGLVAVGAAMAGTATIRRRRSLVA